MRKWPVSVVALVVLLAGSGVAQSNQISIGSSTYYVQSTVSQEGNDCARTLGTPPRCYFNDSPLIAKYDWENSTWKFTGGLYSTIVGTEFTFTITGGGFTSGTFTYNPGSGDPGLKYWSVKAGNQYTVYWLTSDNTNVGPGFAQLVPTGQAIPWQTGVQAGVSHISFFNTGVPVPEPASVMLLGLGLAGLAARSRRRY